MYVYCNRPKLFGPRPINNKQKRDQNSPIFKPKIQKNRNLNHYPNPKPIRPKPKTNPNLNPFLRRSSRPHASLARRNVRHSTTPRRSRARSRTCKQARNSRKKRL
ncbi:hypothetical protein V6Z11_A09G159300 [Gossypium hirsutum]